MSLFQRLRRGLAAHDDQAASARLGKDVLAMRLAGGSIVPPDCTAVILGESGQARRLPEFRAGGAAQRLVCGEKESAWCFHPGPYSVDLAPFALAPELGLRLGFVVDAPDPRVSQQRFDLFLSSEGGQGEALSVQAFAAAVQDSLRLALAQGRLELPPCTSAEEWTAFRAGLNELLYIRFGITVEDCMPVDLGDGIDFAAILRARASADAAPRPEPQPEPQPEPVRQEPATAAGPASAALPASSVTSAVSASIPAPRAPAEAPCAGDDAAALRRLFLELPALSGGLRMLDLPQGQGLFLVHQGLLQRLALLALDVNTMPALAMAAPGQHLPAARQRRRSGGTLQAVTALDEAWGLLARLKLAAADAMPTLLDDADRILANMELSLEQRRAAQDGPEAPGAARIYELPRIEPSL
ncbi:hypothetical protein [Pseudoduganella violacea]|uniref:Uncharacterized protein n=1 Tax=Pseudoduganella violacea TaxID=1715466 RepID=A0A7W5FWD1_9BURK|nr:hypothetical protein [Pseudoduganella violacea]MBB3121148.1 hypothetical protein [Pseudoduganella violacea]